MNVTKICKNPPIDRTLDSTVNIYPFEDPKCEFLKACFKPVSLVLF